MILRTCDPPWPLSNLLQPLIYFSGLQHAHALDRFLPNGDTEILIDFSEAPQCIHHNTTLEVVQRVRRSWTSGVRTRPITIPSGSGAEMMVITFRKGMAQRFFPLPLNEITDHVLQTEEVWGAAVGHLRNQMLETTDIDLRFQMALDFLRARYLEGQPTSACVGWAVNEMMSHPGSITVGSLQQKVGYSPRHFADLFRRQVGITPKAYLRIMRFQSVVQLVESRPAGEIDWSAVAVRCGFYDQAHFINDFRHFSGYTPETYLGRRNEYLNYVPVA